jgi:molecular chaperone GrpE
VSDTDFSSPFTNPGGTPAGQASGTPDAVDGALADIESKLGVALAEAEKLREDWLRAKAETENVRRRATDDIAKAHRFGVEGFAGALLAVKDSLDAALTVENTSIESFKEGVEITARQLDSVFEKFAIRVINPVGEKFDPHRHQAISQVESDQPANTVVAVLQKGYLLHDRVLRPALVTVARSRDESTPSGTAASPS